MSYRNYTGKNVIDGTQTGLKRITHCGRCPPQHNSIPAFCWIEERHEERNTIKYRQKTN
ncbi:MAG: hypothetical protein ACUBOA_05205 [Candidatus Loosdrechtia sp.]|uniref:hypothetical protein n=1 Tax=Candidatus Loosdrechtia sp. TaxID=3101272 RepID=UPI003A6CF898|nr:MAG: hypothetical protein QY305_14010 [Candidatus Jettenia sp. AMX2]